MQEHTILGLLVKSKKQGRQKKIPKLWSHMWKSRAVRKKMFLILETSEKPFFSNNGGQK